MFGQDQNQQDDQNFLKQPDVPFGGPAPGAPAGPVSHDDTSNVNPFAPQAPADDSNNQDNAAEVAAPANADELLDIKQQALEQLSPLVGHLDQSPEEKFRTTMMMIQASDDQSLIKEAYEAAKKIEDEKTRAQALLDVVNEINYFTQHHNN